MPYGEVVGSSLWRSPPCSMMERTSATGSENRKIPVRLALSPVESHGTYQNAVFLLYNYLRRLGGTGILPVACRTGFTHLNGGFL